MCASFLSQLEIYEAEVGLVAKSNTQQHRCFLVPIASFLSSSMILKIANGSQINDFLKFYEFLVSVMDNPNICQLADEETPTSTSSNLGTSGHGLQGDEVEDYNDISSKRLSNFFSFF